MTIVIVVDLVDNKTNGSVMTAIRFAEGLRKRGHRVKIAAIGADGEDDCPLQERYVPVLTEVSAKNQIKFAKYREDTMRECFRDADIVHFIFPFKLEKKCKKLADSMGVATTAAFHCQPENVSYNIHLGKVKALNNFIYRYFRRYYDRFDRIHCPSAFIANQLKKHGYKGELYVISNGYAPEFQPFDGERVKNEKFEIVMTGRLAPEKNQQVLIRAIAQSAHKDDIHLTLYGNGPTKKKLARLANSLNVSLTFGFLPKEELVKRLQQSDLYVHSATAEIEAIAAIEAIACGLVPVIADSELSATPQFALDGRSLFTDNDPCSLAAKIDYWYEHEEERLTMGKVYANSAKKYSLERSLEQAERMFSDQIRDNKLKNAAIACDRQRNSYAANAEPSS